mmetsp:Transcript_25891/g.72227  ORF Transcript_25891/g.72227 Transcript_25891/m.72227 type:complete len:205 (-) Transcript_25891:162-776(-)
MSGIHRERGGLGTVRECEIWRGIVDRELDSWALAQVGGDASPEKPKRVAAVSSMYRLPLPGEPVTIFGTRHRPELNGARAEVISSAMDASGRVTVRVFDSTALGAEGPSRRMQIQASHLVPLRASTSTPSLRPPGGLGDDASVVTCSRAGGESVAARSRCSRASSGGASVFSATARSALGSLRAQVAPATPMPPLTPAPPRGLR